MPSKPPVISPVWNESGAVPELVKSYSTSPGVLTENLLLLIGLTRRLN